MLQAAIFITAQRRVGQTIQRHTGDYDGAQSTVCIHGCIIGEVGMFSGNRPLSNMSIHIEFPRISGHQNEMKKSKKKSQNLEPLYAVQNKSESV